MKTPKILKVFREINKISPPVSYCELFPNLLIFSLVRKLDSDSHVPIRVHADSLPVLSPKIRFHKATKTIRRHRQSQQIRGVHHQLQLQLPDSLRCCAWTSRSNII